MTCPNCTSRLQVRNTYAVKRGGKTQNAECVKCHRNYTFVTVLVAEVTERGDGAYAVAKKLAAGQIEVVEKTTAPAQEGKARGPSRRIS